MTKKTSTKRALLLSALSLLLCVSMLVGSTFAWFTDSVTSGKNKIQAGNLDVELYYTYDAAVADDVTSDKWVKVTKDTDVFGYNLWEPGYTKVAYFKVVNEGSLELKYQLAADVYEENPGVNQAGAEFLLSDYIKTALVNVGATRNEILAMEGTPLKNSYDMSKGNLKANETAVVGLAIWMPTTVNNVANHDGKTVPEITFGINLLATQKDAESDSFGNDYDKDAWVDGMKVYNAQDLQAAINNGESAITLMDNIEVTEPVNIPADATVALNLNGKTLSSATNMVIYNEGTLTLSGRGTVESAGQAYAIRVQKGKAIIDSVDINVKGAFGAVSIFNGADVTINGGNYSAAGIAGKTSHTIYMGGYGTLNINGGTFYRDGGGDSGGVIVGYGWENEANKKAVININGGTINSAAAWGWISNYDGTWTTISATGGVFGRNPSAIVANGYKAVENNGKYYVVADTIDSVVSTAAELATAIANSGVVYVADDIDMANAWTSVKPNGELTIIGNGNTITNLNLPLLTGGVSSKVTISGLTVADSTVAPAAFENGLGSGAFIPYVDAYGNVTFEDCHIKNSTINGNERAAGLVGYTSGQSVTIKNCSVENCEISAVGGAAGLVAYSQSVTTIENCSVKNTKVTATEDRKGTKLPLAGAVIGTVNANTTLTNVTVSGNTVSNNNATAVFNDYIGRWVTGELTIDGVFMLREASQTALNNAITSGKESISLPAGNYVMPASLNGGNVLLQGKTITISGTKDTVIDTSTISANDQFVTGATVAFDGVTLKFNESDPSKLYMGFANTASLTYKNCHITGLQILYGDKVTFENCVIDSSANTMGQPHSVWTYGAKNVNFIDCDFIYGDRAVNCYKDDDIDGGKQVVNFKNCTFTTTDTNSEGGVEINSSAFSVGIEVNMEGCTAPANGDMVFVSKWDSSNGAKTTINVNGVKIDNATVDHN